MCIALCRLLPSLNSVEVCMTQDNSIVDGQTKHWGKCIRRSFLHFPSLPKKACLVQCVSGCVISWPWEEFATEYLFDFHLLSSGRNFSTWRYKEETTVRPIHAQTTWMREIQITVTDVPVREYCLSLLRRSWALRICRPFQVWRSLYLAICQKTIQLQKMPKEVIWKRWIETRWNCNETRVKWTQNGTETKVTHRRVKVVFIQFLFRITLELSPMRLLPPHINSCIYPVMQCHIIMFMAPTELELPVLKTFPLPPARKHISKFLSIKSAGTE